MKTWEIIKALTENPKLRFKNGLDSFIQISDEDGSIIWTDKEGRNVGSFPDRFILYSNGPCCDNLHIDWEPVPEPVDFMTAINSEAEIRYEGWGEYASADMVLDILANRIQCTALMMINGKWYIK
ncbi:hypothetical protein [Desulfosporosinus sp.]|uniref:hypothetical protein n=1 Tax=Desulfosporosinus sp. TaxID=157907 RepID=UPI002308FD27|nr:hypothetical protein [Desulfosporosinus sp.]MDA8221494.1 hypothetical protein [Desulfitobacterium hafniense]